MAGTASTTILVAIFLVLVSFPSPMNSQQPPLPTPSPAVPVYDVADCMLACGMKVSSSMIECSETNGNGMCYRKAADANLQCMGDCFGVALGYVVIGNSTPGN